MVRIAAFLVWIALCGGAASAQTPAARAATSTLEGVTLGESMQQVREALGDPVQVQPVVNHQIWRYIERGGAVFVDVIPRNNAVTSVTVLRRLDDSSYTDDRGVAFGMSSAEVRAKMGPPARQTTNSDDGSVDLWYVEGDTGRIYEFFGDKLGFVQILVRPGSQPTAASNEATIAPADGSSIANAIRIRPPNLLGNSMWIDAFLAMNPCGGDGHWKETSLNLQADPATNDPLAYTIVRAKCTTGEAEKTFFFDTRGVVTKTGPNGSQNTIYIDPGQIQVPPRPSPSPGPKLQLRPFAQVFRDRSLLRIIRPVERSAVEEDIVDVGPRTAFDE